MIRRRRRATLDVLTPYQRTYLETGVDADPAASGFDFWFWQYGDEGSPRETWAQVREDLLAEWIRLHPGTRPWAWWEFDAPPGERPAAGPEATYLRRHGLLSPDELAHLGTTDAKASTR